VAVSEIYRPIDVLDKQVELVRFWRTNPNRHTIAKHFAFQIEKYSPGTKINDFLAERLNNAETFYIRNNIIERLWHFTDIYEAHEHETVEYQDLPCPRGFVFLEKAIHMMDARGRVVSIKAVLWSEERGGVVLTQFSDGKDPLDEINRLAAERNSDLRSIETDLPLFHIMPWAWGRKVRNLTVEDFNYDKSGHPDDTEDDRELIRESMPSAVASMERFNQFLLSLWEFVQEQIPYRMKADRPMLKRLQRARSTLSEVTVVELRPIDQPYEPADPDHVPQLVMWAGRWRVREHKRRWIDKHGNYRETTVREHTKGPAHLQLIEKDRVYHIKR
jgi:hypothetical protein